MADLLRQLAAYCRANDVSVELMYHPDADPGDGSGWALTIGDRTTYGTLAACEERMREEVGG